MMQITVQYKSAVQYSARNELRWLVGWLVGNFQLVPATEVRTMYRTVDATTANAKVPSFFPGKISLIDP
jgi:hypothetical protein